MENKQMSSPKKDADRGNRRDDQQRWMRLAWGYVLPGLLLVWLFQELVAPAFTRATELTYSEFKAKLAQGQVAEVVVGGDRLEGVLKDGPSGAAKPTRTFTVVLTSGADPKLTETLDKAGVKYRFQKSASPVGGLLLSWLLPLGLMLALYSFVLRRSGTGGLGGTLDGNAVREALTDHPPPGQGDDHGFGLLRGSGKALPRPAAG